MGGAVTNLMEIIQPPKEIFDKPDITPVDMVGRTTVVFKATRIEFPEEGGILIHYEGCKYPKKGWPTQDGVWANNMVKRQTLMMIMTLRSRGIFLPAIGFALTLWKYKIQLIENALQQYIRMADIILQPYYLKDNRYCVFCRELRELISNFLIGIGISIPVTENTGKILAHLLEYDEAYKYPLQDALTDVNWNGDLRKEVKGILNRLIQRKNNSLDKFSQTINLLSLALLHPKVKKAFKTAISLSDTDNLKLLEDDYYHCMLRSEYNFRGISYQQRVADWITIHNGKPPLQYKVEIN
jgi:hypothetical protein